MSCYENLVMKTQMNYSRHYSTYASGGTAVVLSKQKPLPYEEQIQEFVRRVQEAECIIVGGASGLSAAGGGDFYYSDTPSFREHFGKFADKYGFKGAFSGMMHRFSTRNEHWGYVATFLNTTQNAPIREPYLDLDRILQGKDFHILTTNQDTQFVKIYPEEKVSEIQGDHRFFQCSQCCQDEIWDAVQPVADMIAAMGEGTMVPDELIPRCPHCGAEMFPWVRGYGNFLQGKKYEEEYEKISKYIQKNKDRKILFTASWGELSVEAKVTQSDVSMYVKQDSRIVLSEDRSIYKYFQQIEGDLKEQFGYDNVRINCVRVPDVKYTTYEDSGAKIPSDRLYKIASAITGVFFGA